MPLTWDVRDEYLVVAMSGIWRPEDLLDLLREVFGPDQNRTFSGVLMDDRDSTFDAPTDDLRLFVNSCKEFADGFSRRVAIVVDSDLKFGLARMSAAMVARANAAVSVFRDLNEAWQWIRGDDSEAVE